MDNSDKKNLLSIDFLRFFAAFSVYYYHQHFGSVLAKITQIKLFNATDLMGAIYAVPLFFLISGFCIHLSSLRKLNSGSALDVKRYYSNRLFRIYPAYLFALVFSIGVNTILGTEHTSIADFMTHLFVVQGFSVPYFNTINMVLWTITVELAFYAVYPLYYFIQLRWSALHALAFSGIVSSMSILYFQLQESIINPAQQFLITNLWVAWCFGAWMCDKYHKQPFFFNSLKWRIISILIIALLILAGLISWKNDILIKNLINIIAWAPLLIWAIQNEQKFLKYKRILTIPLGIGLSSYSLYLLHEPLISLKNYLIHNWLPNQLHTSGMILSFFLIPLICYFNYILVERPFIAFRKHKKPETFEKP